MDKDPDKASQPAGRKRCNFQRNHLVNFYQKICIRSKQLFQRLQATFKVGTEQEKPDLYAPHGAVLTGNRDRRRCCAGENLLYGLRTVSFIRHDHIRKLMVDPVAMGTVKPADNQPYFTAIRLDQEPFPASHNHQVAIAAGTVRSLPAPYEKVFSVPGLHSSS